MSIDAYIHNDRRDFSEHGMEKNDFPSNPYNIFKQWIDEAIAKQLVDANAMVLSTVSLRKKPSSRVVLLRDIQEDGFVFYTNYESDKGKEIEGNNLVALNFFWPQLNKQVRVEGVVKKVSKETSRAYFATRPRKSQLGAWVSNQSKPISSRTILEQRMIELEKEYQGKEVPMPEHWGGYIVRPSVIEFWLGRPSRLHDRIVYTQVDNKWIISTVSP